MIKRLVILLGLAVVPLAIGLLFTYDVIKIDWLSFMEIQSSFNPQEDPLPLPARSVPVQGAVAIPGLGAPVNPVVADDASIARGQELYAIDCALCHGPEGKGNGPFSAFLQNKPVSLVEGNPVTTSDGALFQTISNGVVGKMPALRENLPDPLDRWHIVNFLRSIQP